MLTVVTVTWMTMTMRTRTMEILMTKGDGFPPQPGRYHPRWGDREEHRDLPAQQGACRLRWHGRSVRQRKACSSPPSCPPRPTWGHSGKAEGSWGSCSFPFRKAPWRGFDAGCGHLGQQVDRPAVAPLVHHAGGLAASHGALGAAGPSRAADFAGGCCWVRGQCLPGAHQAPRCV